MFQNLGLSLGTALIGSVFILTLTAGFTTAIQDNPDLSAQTKSTITAQTESGVGIYSETQVEQLVIDNGGSQATAKIVADTYQNSQLDSLRFSMFAVFILLILSLVFSRNLPITKPT